MPGKLLAGGTCQTCMMRDGSLKGRGRRRTALTTEKMAVLAPMPRASTTMAAAENPGLRRRMRREKRNSESRSRAVMETLLVSYGLGTLCHSLGRERKGKVPIKYALSPYKVAARDR